MTLRATGPGAVTASQIEAPSDIEILNGKHVLLTLDEGASVRIEFTVQNGKGYVPSERNRPEDAPIGLIAVDALYSPVKRVAYRVEPTRQGQSLDYDKLIMEVETNGAVSPVDAVAYAARILQDQLQVFITFDEPKKKLDGDAKPDLVARMEMRQKMLTEASANIGEYITVLKPLYASLTDTQKEIAPQVLGHHGHGHGGWQHGGGR